MSSTYRAAAVVAMVMILVANPALLAWGNPPPGRWEKVSQTRPGEKIIVYTKDGTKRKYDLVLIDDEFLHCANNYSGDIKIGLATIDKIIVSKAGKYAAYGTLVGAAGVSLGTLFTSWNGSDGPAAGMILGAGIGAVSGFLAGVAVGAPGETIYISKEKALAEAK